MPTERIKKAAVLDYQLDELVKLINSVIFHFNEIEKTSKNNTSDITSSLEIEEKKDILKTFLQDSIGRMEPQEEEGDVEEPEAKEEDDDEDYIKTAEELDKYLLKEGDEA